MADNDLLIVAHLRNEVSAPAKAVKGEIRGVADEARRVNREGTAAARSSDVFTRSLDRLGMKSRSLDSTLTGVSRTLTGSFARATTIVATGLAGAGAGIALFGLKAASGFEQTHIAFDGLLGSVEKGNALFDELQRLNLRTPFELPEIAQSARMLLGFQIAGEKVVPLMKSITDISAGLGAGSEGLQRIVLNLGQVQAQGRVTGRELRDFATVGFPGYELVASILGKTREEIRAMGDDAVVSSDDFIDAVMRMSGPLGIFGGMAERQMHSLQGLWSNVKDAFTIGVANAAAPLIEQLKPLLDQETGLVPKAITQGLATLGPPLTRLGGQLLDLFVRILPAGAPVIDALVNGIGDLVKAGGPALEGLVPVGKELGASLGELVRALGPEMPVLVGAFVDLVAVLPTFVSLLADLVPLVDPFLRLGGGILKWGPVRDMLAGVLAVLLGYRALSAVVGTIRGVATALGALTTATEAQTVAEQRAAAARSATLGQSVRGGLGPGALGVPLALWAAGVAATDVTNRMSDKRSDHPLLSRIALGASTLGGSEGVRAGRWVLGRLGTLMNDPKGDTAVPRGVGGALGVTLGQFSALDAMTPGRRYVTNALAGNAGGDHPAGRALDLVGSNLGEMGRNVRAAGGYADMHGSHLHAVFGDTPSPRGGRGGGAAAAGAAVVVMPGASLVHVDHMESGVDLERAVRRGIDRKRRDDEERG